MDYADKSLKSQLKRADKLNSSFALIMGDKEIDEKQAILRNMKTKDQQTIPMDGLFGSIKNIFKALTNNKTAGNPPG
jgi:histidyl-tRNA synthetase